MQPSFHKTDQNIWHSATFSGCRNKHSALDLTAAIKRAARTNAVKLVIKSLLYIAALFMLLSCSKEPKTKNHPDRLTVGVGTPSKFLGEFIQYRGKDRSNYLGVDIGTAWSKDPPKIIWSIHAHEGPGGAAIYNGCAYFMDYDEKVGDDLVRCVSLDDGQEIWRYAYYAPNKNNFGISRTVPAISAGLVITIGPLGDILCLRAEDGSLVWKRHFREFGAFLLPHWYVSQCPLIDEEELIIAPASTVAAAGLDIHTGTTLWEIASDDNYGLSYSSILPISINDQQRYVYPAVKGILYFDKAKLFWVYKDWIVPMANIPCPVDVGNGRVLFTGGYKNGAVFLQLDDHGATELWRKDLRSFGVEMHAPIVFQDHIYAKLRTGNLTCFNLSGELKWKSIETFNFGPLLGVGEFLLIMPSRDKRLTLVKLNTIRYEEVGRVILSQGADTFAPMAYVSGRLLLRDKSSVFCVGINDK